MLSTIFHRNLGEMGRHNSKDFEAAMGHCNSGSILGSRNGSRRGSMLADGGVRNGSMGGGRMEDESILDTDFPLQRKVRKNSNF